MIVVNDYHAHEYHRYGLYAFVDFSDLGPYCFLGWRMPAFNQMPLTRCLQIIRMPLIRVVWGSSGLCVGGMPWH